MYSPKEKYKVLVTCLTYNHSPFIADALNGFAMQQTIFPFVCLVIDDASSDGESAVIKDWLYQECDMEYAEFVDIPTAEIIIVKHRVNHNCTFAIYLLKENLYTKKEKKMAHIQPWRDACEYEAFCEGDDCWISSYKLQRQVEYLDNHPDCSLVHTDFNRENVVSHEVEEAVWRNSFNFNQISEKDWRTSLAGLLIQGKYSCITLTVMAREAMLREVRAEILAVTNKSLLMGDTPLWMFLSRKGNIHFIPEVMATYHIIPESATHSKDYNNIIRFYSSCMDMIDLYAPYLKIEPEGEKAKQKYIYFLLRDIYLGDKSYLKSIQDAVIRNTQLSIKNSLLCNTINFPHRAKKLIMFMVDTSDKAFGVLDYMVAKYL